MMNKQSKELLIRFLVWLVVGFVVAFVYHQLKK